MIPTPAPEVQRTIQQAAILIRSAKNAVILTGAGISTPSGLPDFRSAGSGLWTRFLPMEVASLSTFRRNPELFFQWLRPLASHMLMATPNPAHRAIAKLEETGFIKTVITQNIDGLHSRAGTQHVLEIHGTLNTLSCTDCFLKVSSDKILKPYLEEGLIPRCPNCGMYLKPDIILFEEQLPVRIWMKAEEASRTCDLMLVAGTSLDVLPSAKLPVIAAEHGAQLILVNRTPTYVDVRANLILREDVAEVIPRIADEVLNG